MKNITNESNYKATKKRSSFNPLIIDRLSEKYGVSKIYVRECLNGNRSPTLKEDLEKDYVDYQYRINCVLNS